MDKKTDKKKSVLSKVPGNFLNKLENLMGGKKVQQKTSPKQRKPKKIKLPKSHLQTPEPVSLEISNIPAPPPLPNINNKLEKVSTKVVNEKMDSNIILEIIKEQNKYNTDVINKIMYISDNRDSEYIEKIKSKLCYLFYFVGGVVTTYIIQKFI